MYYVSHTWYSRLQWQVLRLSSADCELESRMSWSPNPSWVRCVYRTLGNVLRWHEVVRIMAARVAEQWNYVDMGGMIYFWTVIVASNTVDPESSGG